jgi:cysteine desulfurase
MVEMTYLDHNATTPTRPEVITAVGEVMALTGANPSSVHGYGRDARKRIEEARMVVAALVNASPDEVIFTGGGSEADNLAIMGSGRKRVMSTETEHSAVLKTALLRTGNSHLLPVDDQGVVDLRALADRLAEDEDPALVCVMAANNETGVLQPVREVADIAHAHGALVLCDAVQAAGKIEVDFPAWDVDYMALSAHKIGGPQGVGVLVRRDGAPLRSLLTGGGQEHGLRAGTENVAGIVGFGVAAQIAKDTWSEMGARLAVYRDELERRVLEVSPGSEIFSARAPRLPNTSNFSLPGVRSDTQVMNLDLDGVAVSAGSACAAGKVEPSHVLDSMNVDPEVATTAVRVSFGWNSKAGDVDAFINAWQKMVLVASGQETAA